jgi:predicted DNA-binding transcriptional regulator AlpA
MVAHTPIRTDRRTRGAPHAGTAVIWPPGLREMLGISEPTLWRWERLGKVPARDIEIGGRRGWKRSTIEAALGGNAA